jgi:hypothetical protein
MKKMNYKILFIGIIFVAQLVKAEPNSTLKEYSPNRYQWKSEKNKTNCKSFSSEVAGKEYVASKAVCDLPVRIEVVGTILIDIENYPSWMDDCVQTKIIANSGNILSSYDFWFHQHIPLLKDRDMVLHSDTSVNYPNKSIQISIFSNHILKYDSGKNIFRMPAFFSWYNLEWIDREHTRVTFLIDPDLGPGLPISFSNSIIKDIPIDSLEALAKIAKENKYQESAKNGNYAKVVADGIKLGYFK